MKSLTATTTSLKADGRKALVTYVTAGIDGWEDTIRACIDNGADIIEIGLPFSDPVMDGPVIAQASALALRNGAKTLDLLSAVEKQNFSVPYVVMTYSNVLFSHSVETSVAALSGAGVTGLILPDLTFEQSAMFSDSLMNTDIALVQLVASTTSPERRTAILGTSEGFLYCVAIKGITGAGIADNASHEFIREISEQSSVPTYSGVGIRGADDARVVAPLCDGIIVGTSIVEKMMGDNGPGQVGTFVAELRSALDET